MKHSSWLFISIEAVSLLWAGRALAFPQFVKDGYFSCSSCHVSTGGGDALTAYGRGFAGEKLAMWAKEGEGAPSFGAGELPSWLLLGGHVRWIQVTADTPTQRYADHFWMQRDLNLGITTERLTTYATLSPLPLSKAVQGEEAAHGIRKWLVRSQATENLSAAVGVFYPKYGLGIADHNAYIRERLGFGSGAERNAAEIAWVAETFETALTGEIEALPDLPNADPQDATWDSAYYLSTTYFALEKHRVGLNVATKNAADRSLISYGPHATLALSAATTFSAEADWIEEKVDNASTTSLVTYLDATTEVTKGLWLQLVHETSLADVTDVRSKLEKQSIKLQFFPRPHYDLKLSIGQTKDHRNYSFSNSGSLIIHFWL